MEIELIFCDRCRELIKLDDIIHIEEDLIYHNSCYIDKAFKEFEGICPIESRFDILDLRDE